MVCDSEEAKRKHLDIYHQPMTCECGAAHELRAMQKHKREVSGHVKYLACVAEHAANVLRVSLDIVKQLCRSHQASSTSCRRAHLALSFAAFALIICLLAHRQRTPATARGV